MGRRWGLRAAPAAQLQGASVPEKSLNPWTVQYTGSGRGPQDEGTIRAQRLGQGSPCVLQRVEGGQEPRALGKK